jgi:hypothetical protein
VPPPPPPAKGALVDGRLVAPASAPRRVKQVITAANRIVEKPYVYGGWKSTLRIQQGDALVSMPLFMPKDEAIPAPEVPAKASFTRDFQSDKSVLQREAKKGVSPVLTLIAYLTVLSIALSLIALISWSLIRVDRGEAKPTVRSGRTRRARAELV